MTDVRETQPCSSMGRVKGRADGKVGLQGAGKARSGFSREEDSLADLTEAMRPCQTVALQKHKGINLCCSQPLTVC